MTVEMLRPHKDPPANPGDGPDPRRRQRHDGTEPRSSCSPGIVAAARASGRPVLDAGRGQPNWIATRAAGGPLHARAVRRRRGAQRPARRRTGGRCPTTSASPRGCSTSLTAGRRAATLLAEAIDYCEQRVRPRPRRARARAGARRARRRLPVAAADAWPHIERILQRYLLTVIGSPFAPAGTYHIFGTEGGAAGMAYLFRTLRENSLSGPATRSPSPRRSSRRTCRSRCSRTSASTSSSCAADQHHARPLRRGHPRRSCATRRSRRSSSSTPGNPDSRALPPARLAQLRELVTDDRPDLIIVADTVYATFVEGFRGHDRPSCRAT